MEVSKWGRKRREIMVVVGVGGKEMGRSGSGKGIGFVGDGKEEVGFLHLVVNTITWLRSDDGVELLCVCFIFWVLMLWEVNLCTSGGLTRERIRLQKKKSMALRCCVRSISNEIQRGFYMFGL